MPNPAPITSLSFYLDDSLFPSLPPAGGTMNHTDLMGRPRLSPAPPSSVPKPLSHGQLRNKQPAQMAVGQVWQGLQPGQVTRGRSIGAGVGSGHAKAAAPPDAVRGKQGVRRIASLQDHLPPRHSSKSHTRTSSDPQQDPQLAAQMDVKRSIALPVPAEGIPLASPRDTALVKLLTTLQSLTPASRTPDPPPPSPSSATLAPMSLLAPMAIILEALVWERETLKGQEGKKTLPVLRDGSLLQTMRDNTPQELDWRVVNTYIHTFGTLLSSLLPYLQSPHPSDQISELTKSARQYVGKLKKVFGEVAGMYVDGYGFVRGMWDEGAMKGAAGEVGRWGDLFGV
ncbi:hypothetical protein L198_04684 [Cryptococcus wingfieldii CBS 7118]|uniref:Uncharacterized protein n=1 Tax=Cryptococcus wingfieldii CBS 7118 TaxID=1295528 RepID=A0A1E3J367_9TREE|nr:hypothetical protein L198_04684 [Cryptococcus wingfieldii CBS 7118]ODN95293.1 hypothetical protein L198_04684 [Cryptococcus wingfieldii CBS 7118]